MSYDRRRSHSDPPDLLAPDRLAQGLRKRLEQELDKIVRGAGKVTDVLTDGPGTGWTVVFDTEYAALKAYYHYRYSKGIHLGKSQTGGWFISVH